MHNAQDYRLIDTIYKRYGCIIDDNVYLSGLGATVALPFDFNGIIGVLKRGLSSSIKDPVPPSSFV